ncbi:MAG: DNA methyltransferase [Gammaproteobacteria bacterium HGW-Gammaproteobacteria-1]|jgi:DNA adenine methylase|nr:MAG: DNA methyltransferase [Gammaproteobacteria bacterium HGW-Gammaproteobacteria-1]PKO86545.1 MAG: DNA methyltransferase [Betaproteobacteria bacterium HGW-Betaproteobacteria-12]
MRYYTPLRYPGGKGKLAPFIRQVFVDNDLCDGIYVEPYAGGAGIALELVMMGYAKEVWLNDVDPAIHAFWHSALNDTQSLIEMVQNVPLTIDEWQKQREIYMSPGRKKRLTLAFATLFLNRTNRSGILGGGVIGGLDQTGKWLIDARFNRDGLCERLQRIEDHKHHIQLTNLDAEDFIKATKFPKRSLVYLDPPYFKKAQRLYRNHYAEADHARIAQLVQQKLKTHWVVSYDDAPEIAKLYKERRKIRYALSYSAQTKRSGGELMFFSDGLDYPKTNNPALFNRRV